MTERGWVVQCWRVLDGNQSMPGPMCGSLLQNKGCFVQWIQLSRQPSKMNESRRTLHSRRSCCCTALGSQCKQASSVGQAFRWDRHLLRLQQHQSTSTHLLISLSV